MGIGAIIFLDTPPVFLFNVARPPAAQGASGDTCRLGGMVDALDSKSSSLKECGFESHSR